MALHPEIETMIGVISAQSSSNFESLSMTERRIQHRELSISLWPERSEMAEVRDISMELDGRTLTARLYVPVDDEQLAIMIYFHGGAFVLGDLECSDGLCRRLAADAKMRLVSIEYRLAPEHPYPAAVDDATDSVRFIAANMHTFAPTELPIILVGESAGATLATVAATSTRRDDLGLAAQVLIYPTLGPDLVTESSHAYGTGYLFDAAQLQRDYVLYLSQYTHHLDERVSPLMSLNLAESPPAIVIVAEHDPLRDEAIAYAGLLEHFGTPVEVLEAKGMVHGFMSLGATVPDALDILDDLAAHLHRFVERAS